MKVEVKNIDPCWVEYRLVVEIPDDTPPDEIEDVVMEALDGGDIEVLSGPDVIGTIDSMDQEYEVIRS